MNLTTGTIEGLILKALHSLNEDLDPDKRITVSASTELFGVKAEIDSLSLVSLIVDIESALNGDYNLSISLTDDRAMTRAKSPFTNVQALKEYIVELTGAGV